jgi:hypothetical protein
MSDHTDVKRLKTYPWVALGVSLVVSVTAAILVFWWIFEQITFH